MSTPRWTRSPSLRALIESAREDGPSAGELASLNLRMESLLGAAATTPAAAVAAKGVLGKAAILAGALALASGGAWFGHSRATANLDRLMVPDSYERLTAEAPRWQQIPRAAKVAVGPSARVAAAPDFDESELLNRAHVALRAGDLEACVELLKLHGKQYPASTFEEEREALTIETLCRLGRTADARRRFERFGQRHPQSSYRRRLGELLEKESNAK